MIILSRRVQRGARSSMRSGTAAETRQSIARLDVHRPSAPRETIRGELARDAITPALSCAMRTRMTRLAFAGPDKTYRGWSTESFTLFCKSGDADHPLPRWRIRCHSRTPVRNTISAFRRLFRLSISSHIYFGAVAHGSGRRWRSGWGAHLFLLSGRRSRLSPRP